MADFGDILSRLAQFLGLKPSEGRRLELIERQLDTAKASNLDRLEALKDRIKVLEYQARRKNKELAAARGASKRVVAGSIEQLFRESDRLQGEERIISYNIDRQSVALGKIREWKAARDAGLKDGQLDDIALSLEEQFERLKAADGEAADLVRVAYEGPKRDPVDIEQRMAEAQGETATTTGLSPETDKWLKEVEGEEA